RSLHRYGWSWSWLPRERSPAFRCLNEYRSYFMSQFHHAEKTWDRLGIGSDEKPLRDRRTPRFPRDSAEVRRRRGDALCRQVGRGGGGAVGVAPEGRRARRVGLWHF